MHMGLAEWIASGGAVIAILAVAGWFLTELLNQRREMGEIKVNYLDRFASLNQTINETHVEVLDAIADLRVDVAKIAPKQ